ncbi:eukaryotic protein [Schizosaccharomyces japonicus yFS275]|uniref:Eukaryotic protein n=1 Tax=Schizosaccharomyces japonicus (strain yFS275 / FY16936) TaxID=402676 RepID=B6JZS7_SCHJY|nr:eukaryotic protein [Schizosaccharomyces japonicus yFS275]EEB06077.1 eukaryotic protein [Schizosaccharomyces japonicus yFS275]
MWLSFVIVYVLGGLTFLPLCALIGFWLLSAHDKDEKQPTEEIPYPIEDVTQLVGTQRQRGYLRILSDLLDNKPGPVLLKHEIVSNNAVPLLYEDGNSETKTAPSKSLLQVKKQKNVYNAVLDNGVLNITNLYEPYNKVDAINLSEYSVGFYPDNLREGEVFSSKIAILLKKKKFSTPKNTAAGESILSQQNTLYIYTCSAFEKENWYHALLQASSGTSNPSETPVYMDIEYANSQLQSMENPDDCLWINALFERVFMAYFKTESLKDKLRSKLNRKLAKIETPGILSDILITNVNVGNTLPAIKNPRLEQFTNDGTYKVHFMLAYKGNFQLTLETKLMFNFGSRIKKRSVKLALRVTVNRVQGPVIAVIKPPPSNRLWYAFTHDPAMEMKIEPIISTTQITSTKVLKAVENRFRLMLRKTCVYPIFNDVVFFKGSGNSKLGGAWESLTAMKRAFSHEELPKPQVLEQPLVQLEDTVISRQDSINADTVSIAETEMTTISNDESTDLSPKNTTELSTAEDELARFEQGFDQNLYESTMKSLSLHEAHTSILDKTNVAVKDLKHRKAFVDLNKEELDDSSESSEITETQSINSQRNGNTMYLNSLKTTTSKGSFIEMTNDKRMQKVQEIKESFKGGMTDAKNSFKKWGREYYQKIINKVE